MNEKDLASIEAMCSSSLKEMTDHLHLLGRSQETHPEELVAKPAVISPRGTRHEQAHKNAP